MIQFGLLGSAKFAIIFPKTIIIKTSHKETAFYKPHRIDCWSVWAGKRVTVGVVFFIKFEIREYCKICNNFSKSKNNLKLHIEKLHSINLTELTAGLYGPASVSL